MCHCSLFQQLLQLHRIDLHITSPLTPPNAPASPLNNTLISSSSIFYKVSKVLVLPRIVTDVSSSSSTTLSDVNGINVSPSMGLCTSSLSLWSSSISSCVSFSSAQTFASSSRLSSLCLCCLLTGTPSDAKPAGFPGFSCYRTTSQQATQGTEWQPQGQPLNEIAFSHWKH